MESTEKEDSRGGIVASCGGLVMRCHIEAFVLTFMVTLRLPGPPDTSLDPLTSHLDGEEVKNN